MYVYIRIYTWFGKKSSISKLILSVTISPSSRTKYTTIRAFGAMSVVTGREKSKLLWLPPLMLPALISLPFAII